MVYFFDFAYSLQQLESVGFFDVMLPFMLVFAILYAILQKTKMFGARPGIDAIVAMAISFLAIINPFVSEIMNVILENTVIAVLIIVALMLLLGLVWGGKAMKGWKFIGMIIGLVVFVWILGRVADYYQLYYPGTVVFSTLWWASNLTWIIPILVIIIFAIVIISSGGPSTPAGQDTPLVKIMRTLTEKEEWD